MKVSVENFVKVALMAFLGFAVLKIALAKLGNSAAYNQLVG